MKNRRSERKKCVFCGDYAKLTAEHIWADWLKQYVPRTYGRKNFHTTSFTLAELPAQTRTYVKSPITVLKQGDPHSKSIVIACARCNNEWMSNLQSLVKPILAPLIDDKWPAMSAWEQRILAAWATMFTMVVEFADLDTLATPFEQRDSLRLTQTPPDGWTVWIAPFNGTKWRGVFNHFGWSPVAISKSWEPVPTAALAAPIDTQSTAFVLGRLFVMTLSFADSADTVDAKTFAKICGLKTIWPIADDTIVRPDNTLDDVLADVVSASFQPAPRNMVRKAWEA